MERTFDHIFNIGDLKVARIVVNSLRVNTYIVFDQKGSGIVIDCGVRRENEQQRFVNIITEHHITPKFNLITHAHFDHIWGAQWLYDTYGVLPTIPELELNNYNSAEEMLQKVLHRPIKLPLPAMPHILSSGTVANFKVIHTPGHTRGSVCYYDNNHRILFCGDTLFKEFTGLPKEEGLTLELIQQSIRGRIHTLPVGTLALPGHGPEFYI